VKCSIVKQKWYVAPLGLDLKISYSIGYKYVALTELSKNLKMRL
jgi:hypothetical protein